MIDNKGIEYTLEILRNAEKEGTTDMVATPHYCINMEKDLFKCKEYGKITK